MPRPQDAASRDLWATLPGSLLCLVGHSISFSFAKQCSSSQVSGLIFSLSVHFQNQSDTIICLNILHAQFVSSPQLLQSSDAHIHLALDIFSSVSDIL